MGTGPDKYEPNPEDEKVPICNADEAARGAVNKISDLAVGNRIECETRDAIFYTKDGVDDWRLYNQDGKVAIGLEVTVDVFEDIEWRGSESNLAVHGVYLLVLSDIFTDKCDGVDRESN